jgi:hypothetical protein
MDPMRLFRAFVFHLWNWFKFGVAALIAGIFTVGLVTALGLKEGLGLGTLYQFDAILAVVSLVGNVLHYALAVKFKVIRRQDVI